MLCPLQKRIRRSEHARKETEFLRLKRTRLGLEDFESLKVIGRGAFGEVKAFDAVVLKHGKNGNNSNSAHHCVEMHQLQI